MIYYNVKYDDVLILEELDTLQISKDYADTWWNDRNDNLKNGHSVTDSVWIFSINEESGETIFSEEYIVEAEGYHGDYTEHNTHWGL